MLLKFAVLVDNFDGCRARLPLVWKDVIYFNYRCKPNTDVAHVLVNSTVYCGTMELSGTNNGLNSMT